MNSKPFPVIDPVATGENIVRLRKECGLSVRDLQTFFGFEEPQAIYKWQRGHTLPSVDNLYALGTLLEVSMDEILVQMKFTKRSSRQTPAASTFMIDDVGRGLFTLCDQFIFCLHSVKHSFIPADCRTLN